MKAVNTLCLLTTLAVVVTSAKNDVIVERATSTDPVVANLTSLVHAMSTTVDQLTAKLDAFNTDLSHKADQVSALNSQVSHQNDVIRNLTSWLGLQSHSLQAVNNYCHQHVTRLTTRVNTLEHPIAFTARFSNDSVVPQSITVGSWQHLVFDALYYQTGGANYNRTTGVFTAPSTGTYAFFLTVQRNDPYQNDCLEATVMKNTHTWLTTATACPFGYTSASNMAVTWMRAGDKAFVRTQHSERVFGFIHTTFSGMKVGTS